MMMERKASEDLFFIPMHLERIGDNVELLVRAAATIIREGIPFSERAMREVNRGIEWHTRQIAQKLAGPGF